MTPSLTLGTLIPKLVKLFGWGSNDAGNVGDGTTTTRSSPTRAGTLTDWTHIDIVGSTPNGDSGSASGISLGELRNWGANNNYALGDGTLTSRSSPTKIGTFTDWTHTAIGFYHSLGIRDGKLYGWGTQPNYGIGDNTNTARTAPVQVGTDTNWAKVAVSFQSSFAIKTNGELYAWGQNSSKQLGDGTTTTRQTPTKIGTATDWAQLAASKSEPNCLAIKTNNKLFGWGANTYGVLGDGTDTSRSSPVEVGTSWAKVSTYSEQAATFAYPASAGVKTDGTLWTWGHNNQYKTGRSTNTGQSLSPVQVGSSTDWSSVAFGSDGCMALKTDGSLFGWGRGRTIIGSTSSVPLQTPTQLETDKWISVAHGGTTGFASVALGLRY